ncbi:MAG: hypothetical protein HY816_15235 [Candidatus Wallbacteria bacterium]|nr:hypothetical protein [Candidatus Wallbacteria bacterium]
MAGSGAAGTKAPGTVGELVSVPRVRTVVQLADRRDPGLRDEILDTFVLTGETQFNLAAILSSLGSGKGRGFFLQGSFGSGKSHFLAVLGFLIENPEAWRHLKVEGTPLAAVSLAVAGRRYLPVAVSLVEHGARERLEEIVLDALAQELATRGLAPPSSPRFPAEYIAVLEEKHGAELGKFAAAEGMESDPAALFTPGNEERLERFLQSVDFPFRMRYDRRETFEALAPGLAAAGFAGAVVLIDELSEYLRSKTDARGFNEEIRFLQFLGEFGEKNPLWVVATLQERIEDTGEITQSAFNKIKDRYPGRLALTGKHLEDLIARRLLPKKPGAAGRLAQIHKLHARAFSGFDPGVERFESLYPVHPATLFMLEELKALFSQHRGVVDFISARVGGDASRSIPGILQERDTTLLTPDGIFDHFQARIKEMVETNPFLEIVYRYFEVETPRLLPELAEQAMALKLVKLVILGAISPIRRDFSVAELAEMALSPVTSLAAEPNYQYVADLMEKLRVSGAYLAVEKREGAFKDVYRIDLEADVNLVIRRRAAYIRSTLFPDDHRLFSRLLSFVEPPHLPLASLSSATRRRVQAMWQHTRREGFLLFVPSEELTEDKLAAIEQELATGEADFVFVISPPGCACRPPASGSIALWEPAPVGRADREELATILAKQLLADELAEQRDTLSERVKKQLELELANDRRRVREIFERVYFTGRIHFPGGKSAEPARWGYIPLEQTTERAAAAVLEQRYPGHLAIAPLASPFMRDREADLVDGFFRPGAIDLAQPGARTLQVLLEGYLRPLALLKKTHTTLSLSVDARRSEPLRRLLEMVPEGTRAELPLVLRALRKGPLGMGREQTKMLLWAAVFSGQVSLYADGKRLAADRLSPQAIERATELARGDLVGPGARGALAEVPFLSVVRKAGEQFNVGVQQSAWDELVAYKRQAADRAANLAAGLDKALSLPSLAQLGLARARDDLAAWGAMLDEVAVSYAAREGLERFATFWAMTPGLRKSLERVERLTAFLAGGPERYVAIAAYARHPGLALGDAPDHAAAADALQAVRGLLTDPELPFREGAIDELTGAFERLLAAYGPLYASHHERQHGAGRFEPFRRLKAGREYALLSRLASGLGEGVCDEFPRLQRTLAQVLGRACPGFDPVALRMTPVCRCGLTLAGELELPDVSALAGALEAGVADSLRTLLSGRMREAITAAASGLRDARRTDQAEALERFLALDPVGEEVVARLEELLESGAGRLLREALAGRMTAVERDLDELVEALVDRSFEPQDLAAAIGRWIGDVPAGGWVRVRSGRAGKQEGLVAVVEEAYPDLLSELRALGEERFVEAIFTARWLAKAGLADSFLEESMERPGLASHAAGLRDLAAHLLERHPELAAGLRESLEVRLVADGTAQRLAAAALSGRDRAGLRELVAADDVFEFTRRRAVEVYAAHVSEESQPELVRQAEDGSSDPFRAALSSAATLELAARACEKAAGHPLDFGAWETLHREALAGAQLALLSARAALDAVRAEATLPEARLRAAVRKLESDFADFYGARRGLLAEPASGGPLTLADLAPVVFPKFAKRLSAAGVACVVVDAMRQDFYEHLRREVLPLAQGTFRHVDTLTAWAFAPTLTANNLDALLTGRRPPLAAPAGQAEAEPPRPGRQALEEFAEKNGVAVVKYNALDDRVHATGEDLRTLYREAAMALAPALLPFLDRLPPRTLVVFTADHGFRERPDFRDRSDASRYTHGGVSPFEVLIPVGLFLKV